MPLQSLSSNSPLRLGDIHTDNAVQMRHLFERVFGKPMSERFWHWKYRADCGHALGVWQGDELVAHYGGMGTDIVMDGKARRAVQIVDVMVDVSVRNAVRKTSPFFLAASAFLERFIGYQRPYLLGYGFPSHRAMHLAEHLKLYAPVGNMSELAFAAAPPAQWSSIIHKWEPLTAANAAAHAGEVDALWQRMQQSLPRAIIVRKDFARLRYRYLEHPEHQYALWLLRKRMTGEALAIVVLKPEAERVLLMDIVAGLGLLPNTLRLAAGLSWQRWQLPMSLWLSTSHLQAMELPAKLGHVNPLPICTPTNIWTDGPTPAEVKDRWWLMAGDTDFL